MLGRHIAWRSYDKPGLRKRGVFDFRDPEIEHLDHALFGHHEVRGLQVAVNHTARMRKSNCCADLVSPRKERRQRWHSHVSQQRRQRDPFHVLHAEVDDVVFLSDVINRDDIWMIQASGRLGLLLEPFDQFFAVGSVVINGDGF